jgi:hypothetical protein
VGERLQLGRTLERGLYLALLVRSEREIAKGFRGMSSSWSLQQFQSLCARSRPFLDHKGSISSTSTWRRGSSTRRNLLLRVCVHLQFHCTHQQLLQHAALLPRAHQIQTETAFRDHGKCKLSCLVPLGPLRSSHSVCVLFPKKSST